MALPGDVSLHEALLPQNEWNAYHEEEVVDVTEETERMSKELPKWAAHEPVKKTPQTQKDRPTSIQSPWA
ncbi:Aldehyde dehydrogenase, dimeric NADP-preferring [Manis javanica]|nr:Aldehyde dehydrogenase, dimeric NADP-preferring [Manis javanica]